jgi:nitrate/nitrite transport system substrate-binding protein
MVQEIDRRHFLRLAAGAAAATAAGGLLAACGGDDGGTTEPAAAGGSSTTAAKKSFRKVKLGFIALTDCAPLIMAKELGYYADRGLDVEILKQASWPATRDNLLSGEIDGAHCLSTMPYSVASGISGSGTALKVAMILNNNGQAITLNKQLSAAKYGDLAAAKAMLESKEPTLAMTYPGGTHDLWLRYWLRATKADESKIKIIPIPPAQMVQNMKVGNMDGFCVGEPWNAVAVAQDIGFTHLTTQDLWLHHPEKALVVNEKTAAETDLMKELMGATLQASKWLDDLDNRKKAATTIGGAAYVNAPPEEIEGRMLGKYELGAGLGTKDFGGSQMMFFRDGKTSAPRRSYGYWALAQYQRLGLLKEAPNYKQLVDAIVLRDLYEEVAEKEGVDVPDDDMKPFEVKLDKTEFDPSKVEDEVNRP